jgi:hypothetical protein
MKRARCLRQIQRREVRNPRESDLQFVSGGVSTGNQSKDPVGIESIGVLLAQEAQVAAARKEISVVMDDYNRLASVR